PAGPNNAGLLARNFGDGISQEFFMVERYVGDHADPGIDNIGRVETSAHPNFENRDIQPAGGEVFESHGGQHFEETWMPWQFVIFDEALGGALNHVVHQRKFFVVDGFAVDADAFIDSDEMG